MNKLVIAPWNAFVSLLMALFTSMGTLPGGSVETVMGTGYQASSLEAFDPAAFTSSNIWKLFTTIGGALMLLYFFLGMLREIVDVRQAFTGQFLIKLLARLLVTASLVTLIPYLAVSTVTVSVGLTNQLVQAAGGDSGFGLTLDDVDFSEGTGSDTINSNISITADQLGDIPSSDDQSDNAQMWLSYCLKEATAHAKTDISVMRQAYENIYDPYQTDDVGHILFPKASDDKIRSWTEADQYKEAEKEADKENGGSGVQIVTVTVPWNASDLWLPNDADWAGYYETYGPKYDAASNTTTFTVILDKYKDALNSLTATRTGNGKLTWNVNNFENAKNVALTALDNQGPVENEGSPLDLFAPLLVLAAAAGIYVSIFNIMKALVLRLFKILITLPLAPIALSSFAGGIQHARTGWAWIKTFIAECFSLAVMALVMIIAGALSGPVASLFITNSGSLFLKVLGCLIIPMSTSAMVGASEGFMEKVLRV